MPGDSFNNRQIASEAGKKSSRAGIPNRMTVLYNELVQRAIDRQKAGQKPLTLEDFRQDNYERLLDLSDVAQNFQEKYMIESLIAKLLHTQKVEITVNSIADLVRGNANDKETD